MTTPPDAARAGAYMAHHSRSFRFASLLLGAESRIKIERVYAWCRHTDNLVDAPGAGSASVADIDESLNEWLAQSRAAFLGGRSGSPLIDVVMSDLAASGSSFEFPEALIRGVRSDLRFRYFETLDDLRTYTHDVAAVVGLWLAALHGVRDPWMLERAAALGHAMQLTNILRDVGDDLRTGRVYLPLALLRSRGVSMFDLYGMQGGRFPISASYREVIEDLMSVADSDYCLAREAIPYLPLPFARGVAAAAEIYAGIHDAIRANHYDNFSRRAYTSGPRKVALGARALVRLARDRGTLGRPRELALDEKLGSLEGKSLDAKVISLGDFDSPTMRHAVPRLQLARLRADKRAR